MDRSGWPERMPASELQPDSLLIEVSGTPRTPEQPAESPSKTGVGPVQACVRCRRSKRKCDGASLGCGRCVAAGVSCSRSDTAAGSDPPSSIRSGMMKEGESYTTATGGWRTKRRASPTGSDGGNDQDGSDQEEAAEESEAGEAASFNTVTGPAKKKRTRLCLSCVRCHRLKVKCDKALPCSRCVRGGLDNDCTYTHSQSTKPHNYLLQSPSFPFTSVGEMSRGVYDAWESIHRGDSHWKILIAQVRLPKLIHSNFLDAAVYHLLTRPSCRYSARGHPRQALRLRASTAISKITKPGQCFPRTSLSRALPGALKNRCLR